MTASSSPAGTLSLSEKQERLRRLLLERISRVRTEPASFAQERLWFVDRMQNAGALYNMPEALRLTGALNVAALERALGEIVSRHEVLRTTLGEVDGGPVQVITPFAGFTLAVDDLSALPRDEREAEVSRRADADAARPFNLAEGPLFRAGLLRLGADEHVLLLCMHHVVSDAWSMGVFFRELGELYGAWAAGEEPELDEPPLQYAEFAAEQRERLGGEELDIQLAYWRERLAGAPALLELPADHPRPSVQSYRGASEPIELPAALVERLQAVARREGATLYMLMLGAFQVLLGKYAGSDDVVVGSPIAGRTDAELEELIGFFVNTLVMRTDLSGDPAFREVLRRVRANTLGAYAHQEVPFERLVAELHPDRSPGRSPLFQVMFTLDEGARGGDILPGLAVSPVDARIATSKFDLLLTMGAEQGGMSGQMAYSTDLFEAETIRRMTGHLRRVLEQIAADADVRLSRITLPDAAERARVVEEWNRCDAAYPADAAIHTLFAEQAEAAPHAVAVVAHDGAAVTYGELNARANRLANHLIGLGVEPEARVGLCLERGAEMMVAVLAVLKAGAAYVPLDPEYPRERLAFMVADSGVRVLLTQESLRGSVTADEAALRVVSIDADADAIAAAPADDPRISTGPRGLAYVIYTSGSTGTPKGVAVEHRSVVRLVRGTDYIQLDAEDCIAQASNAAFDAATFEIWAALLNGARMVVIPRDVALSAPEMDAAIRAHGITTLFLTTALFNGIARELPAAFNPVRTLMFGGEAADPSAVRRVMAAGGPSTLMNVYGPTENATYSSWHFIGGLADDAQTVPIGRAIAHSTLLVLDDAMQPVPIGVPGELYVGGDGVARGYLGRAALTADRFVPDPFSAEPGARMYRTGDRVRWNASGAVEYMGRLDGQVKVRGFRIELGEIEAALVRHARVTDCAVTTRTDAAGTRQVVAYIVGGAEAEELRVHLRQSLPDYMVPAAFVALDALPLTPNGKVDRKALPDPDFAAAADAYTAPRTPAEEVIAGIWAEVLGVERAGAHDDFFALGGHSLLATRVVSRIRAVFAVELPLRDLFEAPTVARVAERVEALRRAGLPQLPPVVRVERTGGLPLSFAQERLWFLDRMEPDSPFYNVPAAVRLGGALDAEALERALGEIVHRHEALRTVFREEGGAPVQVVIPFAGFALRVADLSSLSGDEREAEVRRRADADASLPFDLAAGPLFRAGLLRLADDDHVLLISIHHVVSDGWSMSVLFRELWTLYGAFTDGRESPLPALALQYADYAVWQREHLRGEVLDAQLAYWKARLAGAPALLELPTDHARPAVQSYRGASERVELPAELVARLQALARREGATMYMLMLGAFQVLLGRYAGSEDVVVGSPIAGRTRPEVEELIGFFVNTLVLRTDLGGNPTFREVLRRVRGETLGAYAHQDVPFERLVAELHPDRSLSRSPLFQVMFALNEIAEQADGAAGPRVTPVEAETATSKFDLLLALAPDGGGLAGEMAYSTDLFDAATIRRMAGHLRRVLEQVADDADVRIARIQLPDAAERARVLDEWNRTTTTYPRDAFIHALFAEQAERAPDAVAVISAGVPVTYAELDQRANRIAHHLLALGVAPEARVGLCLERGAELLAAILGILKAGGAYVPLDPEYPRERLAFMLADSDARVLVTQESLRGALPAEPGIAVVTLDGDADAIAAARADDPRISTGPRGLACVIYTSGSTGTPKGVAVEHRSVVRLVRGTDYMTLDAGNRIGQASNAAFDAATFEIWAALLNGGALVVIPREVALSPEGLSDTIRTHAINTLFLTTSLFNGVARERPEVFAPLTTVMFGGEAADPVAVRRVLRSEGAPRMLNLYGPTENTTFSSWHAIDALADDAQTVPIGRTVAHSTLWVLDDALQPAPIGVPGELYVGGDGVARGYLGRAALTADRFVPDPFSAEPGARMYRTGDRVRWTSAGVVEYMGRLDGQVKVRGFRIELGEIEATLGRHPDVSECTVTTRVDSAGTRQVVAYVVGGADAEALRAHLRQTLPDYMVPAAFVALENIPITPNGKVDLRALPNPDFAAAGDTYAAPRTPAEEVLAGIWAEVLGVPRAGVHDDFFALGGHSLLATRVVSRVRAVFGVELPLRQLFEAPTVARVAERVEALRRAGLPQLPPVVPVERTGGMPLSFAQERLWFLDRMEPDGASYNVPVAVRLQGALDAPALERALGEIVHRHEALRTVFPEANGAPVQVINPFAGFTLPVVEMTGLGEAERDAGIREFVTRAAARPFNLAAGPLLETTLLRLADDDHVLLTCMHHIVTDGWSLPVLYRELWALYDAFTAGRESPLAPLAVQYADFAVWQRQQLRGDALNRQLAYWTERLGDAPPLLELPTDRPRPAMQSYRGGHEPVQIPAAMVQRLGALARAEGATLYMVLLGAFQVLLGKYGATDDVVVGSPIAGRTRREVEELIGFFVNTLVLRTDLGGNPTFRDVVRRVRDVTLGGWEHQELPFERLVEALQPERSLSHAPVVQVTFALNMSHAGDDGAGLRSRPVEMEVATTKFDLSLALAPDGDAVAGEMEYASDLFDRASIVKMLGHLHRVIEQVSADADVRIGDLDLLDDAERAVVVEEWNRTEASYPTTCIHTLFEAQAARTPNAPAATDGTQSVTYAELDARANRLAHHLIGLGVGTETRVAIGLARGVEMLIAMMAVLKAGGAYVPLDPAYPADRLAFTLRDARVAVMLTQESLRGSLPVPDGVHVVSVDDSASRAAIAAEPADSVGNRADARSLAYLIYTSGSTGVPKGVAIEHESAIALLTWAADLHTAEELGGMLACTSICFDLSVYELFLPLSLGGRVIIVENALALPTSPAVSDVRLLNTVPSAAAALLANGGIPAGVTTVNLAGEPLRTELVDALYAHGITRVYDLYGPSEDTTYSTWTLRIAGATATIGRPISNTRAYVLDAGQRPVPVGVPGELFLAGRGLARGYLGRAALTGEKFIPDPFSAESGERMYRTGDRVRWTPAGNLEYLGRVDAQVKVRGYRIELGEIETALRGHDAVRDCVVVAREDTPGEKRLAAYVAGEVDAETLRGHLRQSLPEYMVPAAFVMMDALPLTPNGKLDRKALPAPEFASTADALPPRNALEQKVAEVWQEVLGLSAVGVTDNFFDLGGTSLLLYRVFSQLREIKSELRMVDLFRHTTVETLAAFLGAGEQGEDPALAASRARAQERRSARRRG